MEVHRRINQHCKFLTRNAENNVPATTEGPLRQKVAWLDTIPDCEILVEDEDMSNGATGESRPASAAATARAATSAFQQTAAPTNNNGI